MDGKGFKCRECKKVLFFETSNSLSSQRILLNGYCVLSGVKRDKDQSTASSVGINEWNSKITPVKCLRDVDRDNLKFIHTHTHTHRRKTELI